MQGMHIAITDTRMPSDTWCLLSAVSRAPDASSTALCLSRGFAFLRRFFRPGDWRISTLLNKPAAYCFQVPFDGLWIDMNEPTNFCAGEVCQLPENSKLHALMASDRQAAAAALTEARSPVVGGASSAGKLGERRLTAASGWWPLLLLLPQSRDARCLEMFHLNARLWP